MIYQNIFCPLTNTKCRRKKLCGISKYITFIQHYSDYKILENHLATNRQRIFCNHFATMLFKKSVFMHLSRLLVLFKLNRPGRLRRKIIQNPVHARDLMGNPFGQMAHEIVGKIFNHGGHGIRGIDGADNDGPLK